MAANGRAGENVSRRSDRCTGPLNRYGAGALTIARVDLRFYPGAHLLRVSNKSPMVGNRYFIQRGEELVALHSLDDIQPSCDKRFDVTLDSGTAADYFRFAHFFSAEGRKTPLVESPQDLRIDLASLDPAKRRALVFIRPLDIKIDGDTLAVHACTFDEKAPKLYRDSYRLTPGQALRLLSREDSGIALGNLFFDNQLKITRSDG